MRLFVDHARQAPKGWHGTKSVATAVNLLNSPGPENRVEALSIPHRLGAVESPLNLIDWMIQNNVCPPKVYIHSPVEGSAPTEMARRLKDAFPDREIFEEEPPEAE
jgi:hypothetical protein